MKNCEKTGEPLHAPIWWINPGDLHTQVVNDGITNNIFQKLKSLSICYLSCYVYPYLEFMVGGEILVAPIIEESSSSRRIYLPKGNWQDPRNGVTKAGSSWIEYDAPLDVLPYFIKI